MQRFDFIRMVPDHSIGGLAENMVAYALMETGKQYAVYVCRKENEPPEAETEVVLKLQLPQGDYAVEWVNTLTGEVDHQTTLVHGGGIGVIQSPAFGQDVALRVVAM